MNQSDCAFPGVFFPRRNPKWRNKLEEEAKDTHRTTRVQCGIQKEGHLG